MKLQSALVGLVLLAAGITTAEGQKKDCSSQEANKAQVATNNLNTWEAIYRFYRQFAACDDGAIAEGISDDVARMLLNRWNSLGELAQIAKKDRPFERFVLRHVDETAVDSSDAARIREKARRHCPAASKDFCQALTKRIAQLDQ